MSNEVPNNEVPNNEGQSVIGVLKDDVVGLVTGAKDMVTDSLSSVSSPETQTIVAGTTTGIVNAAATTLNTVGNAIDLNPNLLNAVGKVSEESAAILHKIRPVLQEATNQAIGSAADTAGTLAKSGVNIGVNMASAVPGLGAVISVGRIMNNIGEAGAAVFKGTSTAFQIGEKTIEHIQDVIDDKTVSQKGGRKSLRERRNIEKRINKSLNAFNNPLSIVKKKRKTRKARRVTRRKYMR
jgi:hypothetical protein